MSNIHKTGRVMREGRMIVFWKLELPKELEGAAESFISSCEKMPEAIFSRLEGELQERFIRSLPIRAALTLDPGGSDIVRLRVELCKRILISQNFSL